MIETCNQNGCIIDFVPPVYVLNNLWDAGHARGHQSITVEKDLAAWRTDFDWQRTDGQQWAVTTYAAAIRGWHWGWRVPPEQCGLPLPVAALPALPCRVAFQMLGQSRYDVIYDLWAHAMPNPKADGSDPRVELMIWPNYSRDLGGGSNVYVAHPTLAGHRWKLQTKSRSGDPSKPLDTFAFLLDEPDNLTTFDCDLREFLAYAVAEFPQILPASWYLTSMQFGPEIYQGAGTLDVTRCELGIATAPPDPAPDPDPQLRDFFAAHAVSGCALDTPMPADELEAIAQNAWALADAMLRTR